MRYDKIRSLTMHPFEQIEIACKSIKNDTKFHNGYNAIGLSQGALLLRGLAQTCPFPKMKNFISFGGPQQGIYQANPQTIKIMCTTIHYQLNALIYSRPSQYLLTPASYWHDLNPNRYQKGSTFLAIINNEKDTIITDYAENLKALERFVMVKYESDEAIIPNESTFFGYWSEQKTLIRLEESELYKRDKLGLKAMNENGQLVFLVSPGGHLELNEEWFVDNILQYLINTS
ncbi:hypothetical protein PVAND_004462 [Polypedilum vanderplanki]|uniref:Palmitoyl-protein thioesterase 1 n=1 Tax=Polypedilum vanderplanki TaxID=319348 RepID=A0A9J6BX84_POLVA|nr:hypothetical protein PVAND_004462 [Polypedilum vanderplanki]